MGRLSRRAPVCSGTVYHPLWPGTNRMWLFATTDDGLSTKLILVAVVSTLHVHAHHSCYHSLHKYSNTGQTPITTTTDHYTVPELYLRGDYLVRPKPSCNGLVRSAARLGNHAMPCVQSCKLILIYQIISQYVP